MRPAVAALLALHVAVVQAQTSMTRTGASIAVHADQRRTKAIKPQRASGAFPWTTTAAPRRS